MVPASWKELRLKPEQVRGPCHYSSNIRTSQSGSLIRCHKAFKVGKV